MPGDSDAVKWAAATAVGTFSTGTHTFRSSAGAPRDYSPTKRGRDGGIRALADGLPLSLVSSFSSQAQRGFLIASIAAVLFGAHPALRHQAPDTVPGSFRQLERSYRGFLIGWGIGGPFSGALGDRYGELECFTSSTALLLFRG